MKFKWTKLTTSLTIFAGVIAVIGSWALYKIVFQFIEDTLLKFGIVNVYIQNLLILLIAIILLLIMGVSTKKIREKIFS